MSSELPRISVVVPSRDQARTLADTLDSALGQGYPGLELIALDGGSTDESPRILEHYAPRLAYWRSGPDGGQSAAINEGVARSTGELVAWLNSDDYYWGDALWLAAEAHRAHPEAAVYLGNGLRHLECPDRWVPFSLRHMALSRTSLREWTFTLQQPSMFVARRAWDAVGGLNEALHYCMDWDLLLRLSAHGPAVLIQEYLSVSREYADTKTRRGRFRRLAEIVDMVQAHTGDELTTGGLHYVLETVLEATAGRFPPAWNLAIERAAQLISTHYVREQGCGDVTPARSDPQDRDYLPWAPSALPRPIESRSWPSVHMMVLPTGDDEALAATLRSLHAQRYPALEVSVLERGLEAAVSGAAIGRARSELCGVLRGGEQLSAHALVEAGRRFDGDAGLELVYGNALWVDAGALAPRLHGERLSAFWPAGAFDPDRDSPILAAPRASVIFRPARLGLLGASDAEWYRRLAAARRFDKLERVMALLPAAQGLDDARYAGWLTRRSWLGRRLGARPR